MGRINQNEHHMTERLERHDRRLCDLEDHFQIHRSPTPTPTQILGEGHTTTMPEPRGEDDLGDPEEAPVKSGHEEPSGFGYPKIQFLVSFIFCLPHAPSTMYLPLQFKQILGCS